MRILFWFRKDLRLDDNTALAEAARDAGGDVVPFYASEPAMLGAARHRRDARALRARVARRPRRVRSAAPARAWRSITATPSRRCCARRARPRADAVYWNDEYEPALRRARRRRRARAASRPASACGASTTACSCRRARCAPSAGGPFAVYTPFRRACEACRRDGRAPAPCERLAAHELPARPLATLERLGFATAQAPWPGGATEAHERRLARFLEAGLRALRERARPARQSAATSRLSADLKFGTLSARAARSPRCSTRRPRDARLRSAAGQVRLRAALARLLRARAVALPARRARRVPARVRRDPLARATPRTSTRGARAAPATRSWTPACASWPRPASCTTACA